MKTWQAKKEEVDRKWWLIDATDKTVGRISTHIARILRGKNKPIFTPHVDTGDFVVVINAEKVRFTGRKWEEKKYYTRSRWFGSLKTKNAETQLKHDPCLIIHEAVRGMLPRNSLARKQITKLKVFAGAQHSHKAQKPETLSL